MVSVEYVNSNSSIQHLVAKCQPFAKPCAKNFDTKKSPLCCEGADGVGGWGGDGDLREHQTLL